MSVRAMNRLAALCVLFAITAIVVAASLHLARQPQFELKRIDVRGDFRHVTAASVRAALAGRVSGNYFTWRLDETRRLFETVPWVAGASVRRVWPDRLLVTLIEHRPLGVWEDGRLLSDQGELFVANPDEADVQGELPEFSGPAGSAKDAARRYQELAKQFAALQWQIDAIDISDRKAWAVRVSSSADGAGPVQHNRIELGRDAEGHAITLKVAQLIAAYPSIVAQLGGVPARIDARYANGLAASLPPKPIAHLPGLATAATSAARAPGP